MTKKDYNRIVEDIGVALNQTVKDKRELGLVRETLINFAKAFAYSERNGPQGNPRFDRTWFFEAVGRVLGVEVS